MNIRVEALQELGGYAEELAPSAMFGPAQRRLHEGVFHSLRLLEDLSFVIAAPDGVKACCLLAAAETAAGGVEPAVRLSNFGHPAVFWYAEGITEEERPLVEAAAKNALKTRLEAYPAARLHVLDYFSGGGLGPLALMGLQREGASAHLSFTHVLGLCNSIEAIYSALRGSYKNLVRKAEKRFDFLLVDENNYEAAHMRLVREAHLLASGKDAHPDCFWDAMGSLVRSANAYLVLASEGGEIKAGTLLTVCGDKVYYSLGAYDRSLSHTGLSHACVWSAIKYAYDNKFKAFEVGRVDFPALAAPVSEKELNIGFFKRGFGGLNRPVLYVN